MSRRRRILLVTAAALALLLACAPLLARTGVARRFVEGRISESLGRPVEIESLDAGWTSGVTVHGLVVRNSAAEFREAPLLEAATVRIEDALPGLVLSGASRVRIDGLKVRVEEQAGGRTNVDDLVEGLAKPRPGPPPGKREARPFRLSLTGASIRVRRLLPRRQPRPIDPFREDPVILDADEGLLAIGLDGDLVLETTARATTLDLAAAVEVGGRRGRADARLRLGPDGPSGVVQLEGIDLAMLGIGGKLGLRAEGSPGGADVKLRAEGLKLDRVDEAWAELSFKVKRDGDGVAFDAVALRTASGAFSLDGKGAWPPRGIELRALASPEPLGLPMKGPFRLDLSGGPFLSGTLATAASTVTVEGEIGGILAGTADVDLADLAPLLREGRSLAGRVSVERFALDGRSLKADATVEGLAVRGFFAEDLAIDRGEVHVDAALSEDRDTVRIARAQLDGLAAEGVVRGLVTGKLGAEGTVRGTLALNPLHARLLGLRDVRGLRGQLAVDLAAGANGIEGRAAIDGLHLATDRGAWDLARIAAEGAYREGGARVHATADGLRLDGTLADGKGAVELDVDAIERHPLLVRLLPTDVRGPVTVRADVTIRPWNIRGTVESAGLLAGGVEAGKVKASFTAREEETGWFVAAPDVVLDDLGVKASLGESFVGHDGTRAGRVVIEGPLDRLATLLDGARPYAPQGRLSLAANATYDGRWSFQGDARAEEASVVLSGKRTPPRAAVVTFDASPLEDGSVVFRNLRVAGKSTELEGTATLGPAVALRMKGRARLEEIAPFAPMFKGSGEVLLDEVAFDLDREGRLVASAQMRAESVRVEGGRLQKAAARSRVEGRIVRGALENVNMDLLVTAARASRGNVVAEDLAIAEKGAGGSKAYSFGTRVESGRLTVGATSWEQVGLDVKGRLDRLLGERPATGLEGQVTFARWRLGPFLWEDAKGDLALDGGKVLVRNLVAGLHGGTVVAQGTLTPTDGRLAWEASAQAKGIVVTEEIGGPLSFVVPFLRVEKKAGQLKGLADLDLKLAADDTTDAAIFRTLAGAGKAHLKDIEAQHSILLPLLSLRLDKAILRDPYRFKDLEVSFEVSDGAIRPEPFELEATPFGIKVKEIEVGLDGSVNALVVPGLLPLRVKGTLDDPQVRPAPLAPFR